MSHDEIAGYRLSPQQRRLWDARAGGVPAVAQCALRLDGRLDAARLERAVAAVAGRHPILTTGFERLPGMRYPVQVEGGGGPPLWRLGEAPAAGDPRAAVAEALAAEDGRAGGTPAVALRLLLLGLAGGDHLLVLTLPDLAADRRSLELVVEEIAAAYAAGEAPAGPALRYVQFAEWQNRLLEARPAVAAEGRPPAAAPSLPFPPAPNAGPSPAVACQGLRLSAGLAGRAEAMAAGIGVPLEVCLLALWAVLLARFTGSGELVVGCEDPGRGHERLRGAVGPFARRLPLAVRPTPEVTFSELARRLAAAWAAASREEPLADGGGETPFAFAFEERPSRREAAGLGFEVLACRVPLEAPVVRLDAVRRGGRLGLELVHDPGRLGPGPARYLAARLGALLASVLRRPGAAIGELDLLGEAGREEVLFGFNRTAVPFAGDLSLPELFRRRAERVADRVALVCAGRALSYGGLAADARRAARRLRGLGVGPEGTVALLAERSPETVVGLLAVLEAGGAVVPLDPASPEVHLEGLARDAAARVLLTQRRLAHRLAGAGLEVVLVDGEPAPAAEPAALEAPAIDPQNLAYALYTSGSSGRPKAVMVSHRSVAHLAAALERAVYGRLPAPLRVAVNAPFTVDASVKQWVQLLAGHTLEIVPDEVRLDPAALSAFARRRRLEVIDCVPTQLRSWLDAGFTAAGMERVLVGGERVDPDLWQRLLAVAPEGRFVNLYGPTECTVDATAAVVEAGPPHIGRPLANVRCHVLTGAGEPLPVGVPGELHIAGEGLGRGYLRRPALTAERFVPDPWSRRPGRRLYSTGDRVRWLWGGRLDVLGRLDDQVKVRGHRVEPGEVEAVLAAHPDVRQAAVLARPDGEGGSRLAAYVAPRRGTPPGTAPEALAQELQAYLRLRLPEVLVPGRFVILDALPVLPGGKVDRRALPDPARQATAPRPPFVPPRTTAERRIADIWRQVLEVERVGLDDNFFDLGGHSLLLARAYGRLRDAYGGELELTLIEMFRHPSVRSLARRLTAGEPGELSRAAIEQRAERQRAARRRRRPPATGGEGPW